MHEVINIIGKYNYSYNCFKLRSCLLVVTIYDAVI